MRYGTVHPSTVLIWCVYVESLFSVCVILPQHYRCLWISGAGFEFLAHDVRLYYFLVLTKEKKTQFSSSRLSIKLFLYDFLFHIQREIKKFVTQSQNDDKLAQLITCEWLSGIVQLIQIPHLMSIIVQDVKWNLWHLHSKLYNIILY